MDVLRCRRIMALMAVAVLIISVMYISTCALRNKKCFRYILPLVYVTSSILSIYLTVRSVASFEGDDKRTAGEMGYKKHMIFFIVYATLLSPSHIYTLFCYLPTLIVSVAVETIITGNYQDQFYIRTLANTPLIPIIGTAFYYILQLRELKRFLDQKDSEQKSDQLNIVLNTQSDSIIIAKSSLNQESHV